MNCPNCGKIMLKTVTGYCCETWGCSRIQRPDDDDYTPNTFHQDHGDPCRKCKGKGHFTTEYWRRSKCRDCNGKGCETCDDDGYIETDDLIINHQDCPECDGTGIYTDPSRI
jgi:DnaJ-class molecular chaperone